MKKTLVALAALAATSAFAQATLYGVVDVGITNNGATTQFNGGGANGGPRLGVKGTEDLGGGLSAVYQIETGLNSGAPAASSLGDRGAFAGLTGAFGTVTMGSKVLSPTFYALAATDASDTNNYGLGMPGGATRNNNSINYTSPSNLIPGLTARFAMVQRDDNAVAAKPVTDLSFVYGNGPLTAALSMADNGSKFGKGNRLGAAYNLGVVKLFASTTKTPTTDGVTEATKYTNFGLAAPMGALTLQADMRQTKGAANKDAFVLSAQYALSKNTSATTYYQKVKDSKGAMGAGLRVNF